MTQHLRTHLLICLIALTGCSKSEDSVDADASQQSSGQASSYSSASASIAVIDLDLVAAELGATVMVEKMVDDHRKELNQRIHLLTSEHDKEYLQMKTRFGDNPTEEQKVQLASLKHNLSIELQKQSRDMQIKLATFRNQMSSKFMEEVKPIAHKQARERGLNVVLSTGQYYAADKQVDITDAVISEIKRINEQAVIPPESDSSDRSVQIPDGGKFKPAFIP